MEKVDERCLLHAEWLKHTFQYIEQLKEKNVNMLWNDIGVFIKGTDLYPHYRYRLDKEHGIEVNHLELVVEKGSSLRETEGLESHFYDAVDIHESMDPRLIVLC